MRPELQARAAACDAWMQETISNWGTLAPGRTHPNGLGTMLRGRHDASWAGAWLDLADGLIRAMVHHFPDTLFWDVDGLLGALWHREGVQEMEKMAGQVGSLLEGYGRTSVIRFRYLHDFTYGFDWAKWVRKDPVERAGAGPFSQKFLTYLENRQRELVALIEADDAKYPTLADGIARNPFGFSRAPRLEARLHQALAEREAIPVRVWEWDAPHDASRDFAVIREECSQELV